MACGLLKKCTYNEHMTHGTKNLEYFDLHYGYSVPFPAKANKQKIKQGVL